MKKKTSLIIIILLAILVLGISVFVFTININSKIVEKQKLNWTLAVADEVGINLDTDKLHFGITSPGNKAKRGLHIRDKEGHYVYFTTDKYSNVLYVEENPYFLETNNETVTFVVRAPKENYEYWYESELNIYMANEKLCGLGREFLSGQMLDVTKDIPSSGGRVILNLTNGSRQ